MPKCNEVNMRKYVAALRSGSYSQGGGHLRKSSPDGGHDYCCLGVACEVSQVGSWSFDSDSGAWGYAARAESSSTTDLPASVQYWLGVYNANPRLTAGLSAINANDALKLSFKEIADLFEQAYLCP